MDNYEINIGDEDLRGYHSPDMPLSLRFSRSTSMGSIPPDNTVAIDRGNLLKSASCSTASIVDPFRPTVSDQPITSQNLGLCDINVLNNVGSFNASAMEGTLDMGWNLPNPVLGENINLPSLSSSMLPRSLSQIPTDLGFIEERMRFSCFDGGNFGEMLNSFTIPSSMSQTSRDVVPMHGFRGISSGVMLNSISTLEVKENTNDVIEGRKDVLMSIEHEPSGGSPTGGGKTENFIRSHDEANQGQCESGNKSVDDEFSTGGNHAEPSQLVGTGQGCLAKGHGSKKRRKIVQDTELDEVKRAADPVEPTRHNSEIQIKGDQNPASTTNKPSGKHGKLVHQASESPKQDYIHVRARRGQATNSHSLAERVRREKISERMKYLQDLVPGCSKVTGKAVMLDEIINYVQSLQQEVEFLSMKLASVNPQLDFDIEGATAKDIRQSQARPSSGLGFDSEMSMHFPLHISKPGTIQAGPLNMKAFSDAIRSNISSTMAMSGGNKDSNSQVPDVW